MTVLLSHLLLNLQSAADPSQGTLSLSVSDIRFSAPHMSGLGGSVAFGQWDDVQDEEVTEDKIAVEEEDMKNAEGACSCQAQVCSGNQQVCEPRKRVAPGATLIRRMALRKTLVKSPMGENWDALVELGKNSYLNVSL